MIKKHPGFTDAEHQETAQLLKDTIPAFSNLNLKICQHFGKTSTATKDSLRVLESLEQLRCTLDDFCSCPDVYFYYPMKGGVSKCTQGIDFKKYNPLKAKR